MTAPRSEIQRHALDYWQIARNRLGLIFFTFLLVFVTAAIITYIMPRKFRGRVEMVIERNDEDVRVEGHQQDFSNSFTDGFFKTQFESITKRKTLDRVVDKLELQKRWGLPTRAMTINKLLANLNPESNIKSDFISIEFYDEDAKLAADVANAIADSYRDTRLEVDRSRSDSAITQLRAQIAAKETTTNAALQKMIAIKKRLGIVEMPAVYPQRMVGQDDVVTVDGATLVDSARDVYKLKKDIRDMSAQIEQLRTLEGDDLIRQASDLRVENDTIRKLGPMYQELLLKKENLLSQGLGPKHPNLQGVVAALVQTRQLLLEAAEDYRKNLDTKIRIAQKQLVETEGLNDEQRSKSINDQASNQEYLKARKEWEILEGELAKLKDTKAQKEIDQEMSKTPVTIYQSAEPEPFPYKPKVALNLGLGGIVGLFLGFGLAFFLEYLDTSVKSLDDVEHYLGVPVLAVVPKNVPVLPLSCGQSADAEAYRILRTNLEFNRKNPAANCFSVVSGAAGEGKSTTLVNLAFVCAQAGYNTLIIDADMRRPRMHTFFNVENHHGLSSYLASNVPLEEAAIQTAIPNLYLMPSGITPADSAGLLTSKRFTELLSDVRTRFDLVLVDSPPILGVSDSSVLAAAVDASIIVVQHRKLPRHMLMRVKQSVEQVGGGIVGVVMNQVDIRSDMTYGYYTGYYHYYSTPVADSGSPAAARRKSRSKAKSSQAASSAPSPESVAEKASVPADDIF
jgi:capsular exopolysaccharide synthesis family protein